LFSRILVPLDGSKLAERALPHAVHVAAIFHSQLVLLRVLEAGGAGAGANLIDPLSWQIHKAESELYLQNWIKKLQEQGLESEQHILEGRTPESIVQFAHENAIDLVVMSTHGQGGLSSWNISSVLHKVAGRVFLPLLIVRAYLAPSEVGQPVNYNKLLLPFDCSKRAECALQVAIAIAQANNGKLLLASVLRRPEVPLNSPQAGELNRLAEEYISLSRTAYETQLEELRTRIPTESEAKVLLSNSIPRALHDLADQEDVDLLVFCAHGESAQSDWPYGSVTSNYLEHGTRSMLIMQDLSPAQVKPTVAEVAAQKFGSRG
jgi:nucleotide-binding universal stress UspA family protein